MFSKNKKSIAACLIIATSLGYTPKSEALLPVTDFAGLAESIAGNIQDMYSWAEQQTLMMYEMNMMGMLEELNVDNMNNAISNVIVRNGEALEGVQRKEVEEMAEPDKDAESTIAVQIVSNELECAASDEVKGKTKSKQQIHCDFHASPVQQEKLRDEVAKSIVDSCASLVDGDPNPDSPMINTLCTQGGILTGGATGDTYDAKEQESVDRTIDLISGPIPDLKVTGEFKGSKKAQNRMLIKEMRKEAFRSLVDTSLHEVAVVRKSPDPEAGVPSKLDALTEFDRNRFGSTEWLELVQNVSNDPNKKNTVFTSEILRKIAVMDSFLVHMSVLQYKQQLRMESLQSAMLALEINPLEAPQ